MKNLSLILNVVLAAAVIYLYVLHFSDGKAAESESTSGNSIFASGAIPKIAYVNSDTLLANYAYFKDKRSELEKKADKLQAEYENRAKGLQNEISSFQRTAGQMTINQAKSVEDDLRKKQQNLLQYQQNLSAQLMEEENKVNEELYQNVSEYLKQFGKDKDFKIVLTYTKGSGVLYADDSLNITQEIIAGLNENYKNHEASGIGKKTSTTDASAKK